MPILVRPSIAPPQPVDTRFNDSRTLDFRTLAGDVLELSSRSWIVQEGVTGLHMPPREVVRMQMPGMAGSILQEVRELERPVGLPLIIVSDEGHADHLQQLSQLQGFLDDSTVDYAAQGGTFDLVANSVSGERFLRCTYLEGMEGVEGGDDSGAWFASYGLKLLAVDPYWHGDPWSTPTVFAPAPVGWMSAADGSYTTVWPGALSSSLALGANMPVMVGGDTPSWATIEAFGPCDALTVTTQAGLAISIPGGLGTDEHLLITTDPRHRDVTFNGSRDWSRVAPGDRWQPFKPGTSTVSLNLTNTTASTSARLYGDSLFKRAW